MTVIDTTVVVDSTTVKVSGLQFSDGYKNPISKLSFDCDTASSAWLGKPITATLHIGAVNALVFTGFVDEVVYSRFVDSYDVTCSNVLRLAQEHWLVPDSLESPWSKSNIAAEDLVEDLLAEAGIIDYVGNTSLFTFGTQSPAEFMLMSILDAIDQINNILAYTLYVDGSTVYWDQIFPVPSGSPVKTLDKFIQIDHSVSTKNLRNKVVVFGKNGIKEEASAVSPYLPTDFYQTAIVSSELIDTSSMASQSAAYNLQLYNKLTEQVRVDIEGDPTLKVNDTVHVTHAPLSIDSDWFVYSLNHDFGNIFTTTMVLRK